METEECKGCASNYCSCVYWRRTCPCVECLIKGVCRDSCNDYNFFEDKCAPDNEKKVWK
jgi:hypothetical protein